MKPKQYYLLILFCTVFSCPTSAQQLMGEADWFPFVMPDLDTTETAVDLSFLNESLAGETGFVKVRNGHFVNGAGQPVRFFGTNVTFASCFPDKAISPIIAKRMKRMGYNVVRFHHMDMRAAPSGIWNDDLSTFNSDQVDKLDWFIYHLKRNGIYTNLNLHVSRNYPDCDYEAHQYNFGKAIDNFYRPYIKLQKDYARNLLTHRNPYTKTTYLDEPAIAFVEVNNENSLLSNWRLLPLLKGKHRKALEDQWQSWLKTRKGPGNIRNIFTIVEQYDGLATEMEKELLWSFLVEIEMEYTEEMFDFLRRDLACRSLLCNTQASYSGVAGILREATYSDFIDLHAYWQHPSFTGARWSRVDWLIKNTSMVSDKGAGTLQKFGQHRVANMPLTISEYDHPAPNFYCAEMYPILNAVAAYQDWDGIYHFNYNVPEDESRITGFFSETGHPLKEVFIPVGAALFRMAAVKPGSSILHLTMPKEVIVKELVASGDALRLHRSNLHKVWEKLGVTEASVMLHKMQVSLEGTELGLSRKFTAPSEIWQSSTSELAWNHQDSAQAVFTINAPTAKAAVGYIGNRTIELGDVTISMEPTEFNWATIAIVSLDSEPFTTSSKVLMVAAGRAQNTGMQWNESKPRYLTNGAQLLPW